MATGTKGVILDDAMFSRGVIGTMIQKTLDVSVIICAYTEARWPDLIAAVESL
ncbi:MAG: hypothetical protein ACXWPS_00810 [Ktedonobacteraceae bacterium]